MSDAFAALDEAWTAAVVLPDGWRLRSIERNGTEVEYVGGRKEYVEWWEATARGPKDQEVTEAGALPVFALFHLVSRVNRPLRDRRLQREHR